MTCRDSPDRGGPWPREACVKLRRPLHHSSWSWKVAECHGTKREQPSPGNPTTHREVFPINRSCAHGDCCLVGLNAARIRWHSEKRFGHSSCWQVTGPWVGLKFVFHVVGGLGFASGSALAVHRAVSICEGDKGKGALFLDGWVDDLTIIHFGEVG